MVNASTSDVEKFWNRACATEVINSPIETLNDKNMENHYKKSFDRFMKYLSEAGYKCYFDKDEIRNKS